VAVPVEQGDRWLLEHAAHRLVYPTPPVSRSRSTGTVRESMQPPAVVATTKRMTAGPQRATRLKSQAFACMQGRPFTSGELAAALRKGRGAATAVLNSWVSLGVVTGAGTRKEASGQTATVWKFNDQPHGRAL
jgi:hypothetical protein